MKRTDGAGAAAVLALAGVVTLLGSLGTWADCPTTPCGGFLQGSSSYSGLDLGFGVVTGLAGLILAVIGLHGLRHKGVSRLGTAAVLVALLIVVTAGASVMWMYVVSGEDYRPLYGAILVGIAGLIALAASLRLRTIR